MNPNDDATQAGAEMFREASRLNRLKAEAEIAASMEQAMYWRQMRMDHNLDRMTKGLESADVSGSITLKDKLLSGDLAQEVSQDDIVRSIFLYFKFCCFDLFF